MNKFAVVAFSLFMGLSLSVSVINDAEAKRFGGGKSFGSKSFQKTPAKRTSTSKPSAAAQQNTSQKQALAKKGGMMGMLGGLMIGGMLGALFFGGAFENIDFMDILMFGGIAFLLYKIFTRRRSTPQGATATANGAPMPEPEPENDQQEHVQTRQATKATPDSYGEGSTNSDDQVNKEIASEDQEPENILTTGKIPRSFDQKNFLVGAENVFTLMQKAWDNGDLGDLRQFCNDEVFGEIQDQIRANKDSNTTEILAMKSELVNVVKSGNSTEATVVFNAEIKENGLPIHIQEVWYFIRPNNRQEHTWLLEGIQQLED